MISTERGNAAAQTVVTKPAISKISIRSKEYTSYSTKITMVQN